MGINKKTGRINRFQHKLRPEQRAPSAESLPMRHAAYFGIARLRAGKEGRLWLDPEAHAYTEEEARENLEPQEAFWGIRVPYGFVLDTLGLPFTLDGVTDRRVTHYPNFSFRKEMWFPVLHVVENSEDRAELETIMFDQYHIAIGRVAMLAPDRHED